MVQRYREVRATGDVDAIKKFEADRQASTLERLNVSVLSALMLVEPHTDYHSNNAFTVVRVSRCMGACTIELEACG